MKTMITTILLLFTNQMTFAGLGDVCVANSPIKKVKTAKFYSLDKNIMANITIKMFSQKCLDETRKALLFDIDMDSLLPSGKLPNGGFNRPTFITTIDPKTAMIIDEKKFSAPSFTRSHFLKYGETVVLDIKGFEIISLDL